MKELQKIHDSLIKLQEDFNIQLRALTNDSTSFHNSLIDLSIKYPEFRELLQFIVLINDKVKTDQNLFIDIMSESFNEILKSKQQLIDNMIAKEAKETAMNKISFIDNISNIFSSPKDMKIAFLLITITAVALAAIFAPEATLIKIIALIPGV